MLHDSELLEVLDLFDFKGISTLGRLIDDFPLWELFDDILSSELLDDISSISLELLSESLDIE